MKIEIEVHEATEGKFCNLYLSFEDLNGITHKVPFDLHLEQTFEFEKANNSVKFDLLFVAIIIYGIDNLIPRDLYAIDGWSREIEVTIPVNNLLVWEQNKQHFQDMLNFLTGDYWTISLVQMSIEKFYMEFDNKKPKTHYEKDKIVAVSLFSGGLDSLIGVINELEKLKKEQKILLLSHFDSNSSGANKDQTQLYNYLNDKYKDRIYWLQSKIRISRRNMHNVKLQADPNYRSRSLLFIAIGIFLSTTNTLIVPENGTISINYPLTPSRVSSLSTRTTHPYFIKKLQELIDSLGIKIKIKTPYKLDTKGEMVINCANIKYLSEIADEAVSCGKRKYRQNWKYKSKARNHCGMCMPCIYRRAALNKKNLDSHIKYGTDLLTISNTKDYVDMPALFHYLKKPLSKEQIKTNLLLNGSFSLEELESYAELVLRSKNEIRKWLQDNGNEYIKSELRNNA